MTSTDELTRLERRMAELMAESARLHTELAQLRQQLQGMESEPEDGEGTPLKRDQCGADESGAGYG